MDSSGIISSKQTANTPSIQSGTVAILANTARSSYAIQNQGTATLYVLLGNEASSYIFHLTLAGSTANDNGLGATLTSAEGVVYSGVITVSGNPIRFTTFETS